MNTEDDVVVIGDMNAGAGDGDAVVIREGATGGAAAGDDLLPKHAVLNESGSVTLPLMVAVTLNWRKEGEDAKKDVFTKFEMRRLTGKDMRQISSAARGEIELTSIALCAGIPLARFKLIYDRMDAADTMAAAKVVTYFLGNGPKTGL